MRRYPPVHWNAVSRVGPCSLVVDLGAQVIPIDGKTLKGSYDRNGELSSLHFVSAWASEHRLFLGQVTTRAFPCVLRRRGVARQSR